MIVGDSRNERQQLVRVRERAPEVKGQASLCPGTKWIHRHFAAWNGIEPRAGKGHNAAGIMVPIAAVVATPAVIAEEVFPEGAAVLGEVVADANGMQGNSGGEGDFQRRHGRSGERRGSLLCGAALHGSGRRVPKPISIG